MATRTPAQKFNSAIKSVERATADLASSALDHSERDAQFTKINSKLWKAEKAAYNESLGAEIDFLAVCSRAHTALVAARETCGANYSAQLAAQSAAMRIDRQRAWNDRGGFDRELALAKITH